MLAHSGFGEGELAHHLLKGEVLVQRLLAVSVPHIVRLVLLDFMLRFIINKNNVDYRPACKSLHVFCPTDLLLLPYFLLLLEPEAHFSILKLFRTQRILWKLLVECDALRTLVHMIDDGVTGDDGLRKHVPVSLTLVAGALDVANPCDHTKVIHDHDKCPDNMDETGSGSFVIPSGTEVRWLTGAFCDVTNIDFMSCLILWPLDRPQRNASVSFPCRELKSFCLPHCHVESK